MRDSTVVLIRAVSCDDMAGTTLANDYVSNLFET